jgi:plastocyanin
MGRKQRFAATGVALLVGAVGYCVVAAPLAGAGGPSRPAAGPSSATVVVKAVYVPVAVVVGRGGTVVWSFEDGKTAHTVTADDNSFGSPPNGQKSGTFEHVFSEPGTVRYHCDFHPNMFGTVTVS